MKIRSITLSDIRQFTRPVTVGSVIPTKGAVIPAAVGVDIGCGMMAARTSLVASDLPDNLEAIRSAIEQVRQLIAEWRLTAEDCGFKSVAASGLKKAKSAVAAKYRGPNGETWSGRGRAPKWLEALEAQGRQRSEFSIA